MCAVGQYPCRYINLQWVDEKVSSLIDTVIWKFGAKIHMETSQHFRFVPIYPHTSITQSVNARTIILYVRTFWFSSGLELSWSCTDVDIEQNYKYHHKGVTHSVAVNTREASAGKYVASRFEALNRLTMFWHHGRRQHHNIEAFLGSSQSPGSHRAVGGSTGGDHRSHTGALRCYCSWLDLIRQNKDGCEMSTGGNKWFILPLLFYYW